MSEKKRSEEAKALATKLETTCGEFLNAKDDLKRLINDLREMAKKCEQSWYLDEKLSDLEHCFPGLAEVDDVNRARSLFGTLSIAYWE